MRNHGPVLFAWRDQCGGLSLKIEYCDKHGSNTERVIDPLMCHGSLLVAYCHLRDEQRTFRLDRIETIERIG